MVDEISGAGSRGCGVGVSGSTITAKLSQVTVRYRVYDAKSSRELVAGVPDSGE